MKIIKRIFKENIIAAIFWILIYLYGINRIIYTLTPFEKYMLDCKNGYSLIYHQYIYPIPIMLFSYLAYRYFKVITTKNKGERYTIYAINLLLAILINKGIYR
ncbi:MAG: hypothetical protein LBC07_01265 [Elusimicrobiota bacterium]|jgi:hypothetical protein|nr:hypothetical protein [Elusimicrobiota bacterium]